MISVFISSDQWFMIGADLQVCLIQSLFSASSLSDRPQDDSDSGSEDVAEVKVDDWLAFQCESEVREHHSPHSLSLQPFQSQTLREELEVVDQSQQIEPPGQSEQRGHYQKVLRRYCKTKCLRQRLKRGVAALESSHFSSLISLLFCSVSFLLILTRCSRVYFHLFFLMFCAESFLSCVLSGVMRDVIREPEWSLN